MTADVELLPLYAELQGHPKIEIIKHYARANMEPLLAEIEHMKNMALMQAARASAAEREIEALRAEVAAQGTRADAMAGEAIKHEARAKRLTETLRDARDRMLGQVKWVACDCGCERDKPADAASVVWLRAIALLRDQEDEVTL